MKKKNSQHRLNPYDDSRYFQNQNNMKLKSNIPMHRIKHNASPFIVVSFCLSLLVTRRRSESRILTINVSRQYIPLEETVG